MMNHPQVATETPITRSDRPETYKNHYNKEAARGASFSIGKKRKIGCYEKNVKLFFEIRKFWEKLFY